MAKDKDKDNDRSWSEKFASGFNKAKKKIESRFRRHNTPPPPPSRTDIPSTSNTVVPVDTRLTSPPKSDEECPICKAPMTRGQPIFSAECNHVFHFICIRESCAHVGPHCPICRNRWEVSPGLTQPRPRPPLLPAPPSPPKPLLQTLPEDPDVFDDDEPLDQETATTSNQDDTKEQGTLKKIEATLQPHLSSFPKAISTEEFPVLLRLKAPPSTSSESTGPVVPPPNENYAGPQKRRAPVDLVAVVDISGSMSGTKIVLVKQALGFLIENLHDCDRLSLIVFASTSRRICPLQRMTPDRRARALQAVNSLAADEGTNIIEGLRKGARVIEDRRVKNPVSAMMLLSDGRETQTVQNSGFTDRAPDYRLLVPLSIRPELTSTGFILPVHTFGFGHDHDSTALHMISEVTGGTYFYIENEPSSIEPAFAQCLSRLLIPVVKDVKVRVACVDPEISLTSIKCGDYINDLNKDNKLGGTILIESLYANEERGFLLLVKIPAVDSTSSNNAPLFLKVLCNYKNAANNETVSTATAYAGMERRGDEFGDVSTEVDGYVNRAIATEAMKEALTEANRKNVLGAAHILATAREQIKNSVSMDHNDTLAECLDRELMGMELKMVNQEMYERSGRAYLLSGLSSYSWQRVTTRRHLNDTYGPVQELQR